MTIEWRAASASEVMGPEVSGDLTSAMKGVIITSGLISSIPVNLVSHETTRSTELTDP